MKNLPDAIQNEIIVIAHHVKDIEEGLKDKDYGYVQKGLNDIKESLDRLSKFTNPEQRSEIDRIAEMMPEDFTA